MGIKKMIDIFYIVLYEIPMHIARQCFLRDWEKSKHK